MALNSTVRWFLSTMPDAPEIRDQPGGIIGVLDACLINGFASETVNTLTVVSGVATVNISGGHDYEKHAVIRIAGADPATLNGDWRIATVPDGSNLTFAAPGIADVSATGTITAIRATPGYWEKAYSDTHKGAYRSTHEDATGLYLRVDDSPTGTNSSPVRGYETMTGIDAGENLFPTEAQAANYVWKRTNTVVAGSLPRPWLLVADEAFFLFAIKWHATDTHRAPLLFFGDPAVRAPLDGFACAIGGHANSNPSSGQDGANGLGQANGGLVGQYIARNAVGAVGAVALGRYGSVLANPTLSDGEAFPALVSGGYLWGGYFTLHDGNDVFRGQQPGTLQGLTNRATTIASNTVPAIVDPSSTQPRALMVAPVMYSATLSTYVGIDIEGPWR